MCTQIRSQNIQEWQAWHKPRDDSPFSLPASTQSSSHSTRSHTSLSDEVGYFLLLSHPNWHRLDSWLCLRCEEEIETSEHALLLCPACQYTRGSFTGTLDLKSSLYDHTATKMLAKSVRRTFPAYPSGFTPPPEDSGAPPISLVICSSGFSAFVSIALFIRLCSPSCFARVFLLVYSGVLFWCSFSISYIFYLMRNVR